jgi:hypothetical protein
MRWEGEGWGEALASVAQRPLPHAHPHSEQASSLQPRRPTTHPHREQAGSLQPHRPTPTHTHTQRPRRRTRLQDDGVVRHHRLGKQVQVRRHRKALVAQRRPTRLARRRHHRHNLPRVGVPQGARLRGRVGGHHLRPTRSRRTPRDRWVARAGLRRGSRHSQRRSWTSDDARARWAGGVTVAGDLERAGRGGAACGRGDLPPGGRWRRVDWCRRASVGRVAQGTGCGARRRACCVSPRWGAGEGAWLWGRGGNAAANKGSESRGPCRLQHAYCMRAPGRRLPERPWCSTPEGRAIGAGRTAQHRRTSLAGLRSPQYNPRRSLITRPHACSVPLHPLATLPAAIVRVRDLVTSVDC